ncbi:PHO87 (YCR037C) and PHO90 (YJL198W) [Zygosaccharomyces parabailii]|nr:PHO87 (YCR037C) and PHO90 (YJL198W) [Zygosaccharomyces parabailii]CDH08680.1 probable Inorganic phosphate transporter PHO87 [Zygosaccharomyces bailii ISA1307]
MRFSHFLQYNSVPEWQNHYMNYSELKNLIYTLQTDELRQNGELEGEENATASSSKLFGRKIKNKLFSKGSSSSSSGDKETDKSAQGKRESSVDKADKAPYETIQEETFELDELPSPKLNPENMTAQKHSPMKRFKDKFFDSRRSSLSSEGKTLFSPQDAFLTNLTAEKLKVDDFYKRTEAKFYEKFGKLVKDLEKEGVCQNFGTIFPEELSEEDVEFSNLPPEMDKAGFQEVELTEVPSTSISVGRRETRDTKDTKSDYYSEEDLEDDYDDLEAQDNTALLNCKQLDVESQKKSLLKQSIIYLYIDLCQLKSFIELNRLGFGKIAKKFDKVLHMNTREELIQSGIFFNDTYIFQPQTLTLLNSKIAHLIEFYAIIKGRPGDIEDCKRELKCYLHDHIVWERSNSWKDMLGLLSWEKELGDTAQSDYRSHLVLEYKKFNLPRPIRIGKIQFNQLWIPSMFLTMKALNISIIFIFTLILMVVHTFKDPAQGRCMALVECVALLWATESMPLFATAVLVPMLTVLFKVLKDSDTGHLMKASDASKEILGEMWSSTMMILLGGFTLAEALAQYDVAKVLASWLLSIAGVKPRNVLLMSMGVVFFLAMWISNVAAPTLTYSLMAPVLDSLDADVPFAKAIVLGVAIAADIGGMSSPISSPQNVVSMDYLKVYGIGWGQFFATALPCGVLAMIFCWGVICATFKISTTKLEKFKPMKAKFTLKQWYVIFVSLGTILLWCVEGKVEPAFGSSGQIAVLPMVLFFGTGMLSVRDFNTFPWSIVMLAMGGVALGKAVSSSGLLATVALALQKRIENDGTMAILCIFGILMLVVGTFVSHTVSAIIIVPLVQEVGSKLADPKAAPILVFGCSLLASSGLALPSSGFPNTIAISMEDRNGKRYLDVKTFITRGLAASLIVFVCIITLGYGIMKSILKPT